VRLDRDARRVEVDDEIETTGAHALRLAFHLGCAVSVRPEARSTHCFALEWQTADGACASATLSLPDALEWRAVRGALDPVLGWYSPSFGVKQPTTTLVGTGTTIASARRLHSELIFHDGGARQRASGASSATPAAPDSRRGGRACEPDPRS
jgi:hypothetical protein